MSLHWTLIAGFLYAEIAVILLLLLPFLSNRTWNKLFKSRFLKGLENQLIYYFYVLVAILVLFFLGKQNEIECTNFVKSICTLASLGILPTILRLQWIVLPSYLFICMYGTTCTVSEFQCTMRYNNSKMLYDVFSESRLHFR